ncbi:MAG: pyridoxal-phosphate-dependent aminotransferase family protein [Chthoniobacterales bacterium]
MSQHTKLFIPGPVEISAKTYQAFCRPMIGHRSKDFQELYASVQPRLQTLFGTERPVFLSTSSAWGVMEAAIRNLAGSNGVLNCMCGAFSDKWHDVSKRAGKKATALQIEWGQALDPVAIREALEKEKFDAVTVIHSETSTGVLNPLAEIAKVLQDFPETLLIVDTVSSFSTEEIKMDDLGIDVLLTGSQKALAMPPGLALFSVSEAAMKRSESTMDRGYYFDFGEFLKNHEKNMTPSTPSIAHIYALQSKLDEIFEEGPENRYARHAKLNAMVHDWVKARGFEFFAPEGHRSRSLTCVANNREVDVAGWIANLKAKHHCIFDGGYGKLKGKTFRISNMGDETEESISLLLSQLDDTLPS